MSWVWRWANRSPATPPSNTTPLKAMPSWTRSARPLPARRSFLWLKGKMKSLWQLAKLRAAFPMTWRIFFADWPQFLNKTVGFKKRRTTHGHSKIPRTFPLPKRSGGVLSATFRNMPPVWAHSVAWAFLYAIFSRVLFHRTKCSRHGRSFRMAVSTSRNQRWRPTCRVLSSKLSGDSNPRESSGFWDQDPRRNAFLLLGCDPRAALSRFCCRIPWRRAMWKVALPRFLVSRSCKWLPDARRCGVWNLKESSSISLWRRVAF